MNKEPVYLNYVYEDRSQAGVILANVLMTHHIQDPLVIALPRGGVPVAKEIAKQLGVQLDVVIVRKIGMPGNREYGIGAMSEDLKPLFNSVIFRDISENNPEIKKIVNEEKEELLRRIKLYRGERELPDLTGKTVILVDDGIATGITAAVAARFLKERGAQKIILAAPVGPRTISKILKETIDEFVCPNQPLDFSAVGLWYSDFHQITDEEVLDTLQVFHPNNKEKLKENYYKYIPKRN